MRNLRPLQTQHLSTARVISLTPVRASRGELEVGAKFDIGVGTKYELEEG